MANKQKRIEVLSPIITCTDEHDVRFNDLLSFANEKSMHFEIKTVEYRQMQTNVQDSAVGIMITGQNKDLPPKRDNRTGQFSSLGIDVAVESLSYGNILFYNSTLNVLLYEVNLNGCDTDKLITFLVTNWNIEHDVEEQVSLKFTPVVRKAEYERAMRLGFYKEFYAELTCPSEIAQAYKDSHEPMYNIAKNYVDNAVKSNSDTIVVKMTSFGKKGKDVGLNANHIKKVIDSFHFLQLGCQRHNVAQLKVKGYFTNPDDPSTMQPVNLIADTFNEFIKLEVKDLHTNLQESERKSEIERIFAKIEPELRRIINNE